MTKYRIAIHEFGQKKVKHKFRIKPKDFRNIMIDSDQSIDKIRDEIIKAVEQHHEKWKNGFINDEVNKIQKKKMKEIIDSDKFDKHAVGQDIECEEFIRNEIDFEVRDR